MKLKESRYNSIRKFYIIRGETEIKYTKHRILGKLYITLNYWKFIKFGRCQILSNTTYYLAFPRVYRKAEHE